MGKRITEEEFMRRFHEGVLADKYDYSKVVYGKIEYKVEIVCPIHGSFWQLPGDHWNGRGCQDCGKKTYTWEEYKRKANLKHNNKYSYPDQTWTETRQCITIICPVHGAFTKTASIHLLGQGCALCAKEAQRLSWNTVLARCIKAHGDKYTYDESGYYGNKQRMKIICPVHGVFWQLAEDHYSGHGCSKCNNSRGEEKIRLMLSLKNIDFVQQKKYDACYYIRKLPFDFYVPELDLLVEYQGRQHYMYVDHFYKTEEEFKHRQYLDKIKKEYAEKNHNFLCIPYWDFDNIESILEETINKLK